MRASTSPRCPVMTECVDAPPTGRLVPYRCPAPDVSADSDVPCRMGRSTLIFGMRIAPITPPPASNSDWYSSSRLDAVSCPETCDPPATLVNGSTASPKTGCPDSASRELYAYAAFSALSACGYGHPATRAAVEDVSRASRTDDWYCRRRGWQMTVSPTANRIRARPRSSLACHWSDR